MKNVFLNLFAMLIAASTFAQAPQLLNYQGVARSSSGIITTPVGLRFTIHDLSSGGTVLYQETATLTPNAHGIFNTLIGGNTLVAGAMTNINWGSGSKYLEVEMDASGGTSYTSLGSTQLVSVPYALQCNKADNGGWSDYLIAEDVESSGVNGGSSIAGWNTRVLNTIQASSGTAISYSLIANTITLNQPGKYYIHASAPAYQANNNKLVVRDIGTGLIILTGTSQFARSFDYAYVSADVEGVITVTSSITFKLDHYITNALGASGLGASIGVSGVNEVYAKVLVQKIQ